VVVVVVVVVVTTGASADQLTMEDLMGGDVEQELKITAAATTVNPGRTNLRLTETTYAEVGSLSFLGSSRSGDTVGRPH
jgi:hypothetical protein